MKLNKNWAWENNWFPFSILSLMIFPFLIVVLSIPKPIELLSSLPLYNILIGLLCGIIIYGGSLLFGNFRLVLLVLRYHSHYWLEHEYHRSSFASHYLQS